MPASFPTRAALFAPIDGNIPTTPTDYLPSPDNTFEHVIDHLMAALQYPDAPSPGAGAINLHNFHVDLADQRDADAPRRTADWFRARIPEAFKIADARAGPILHSPHSDWAAREHNIITTDGERFILRLNIRRPLWGSFAHCWMLASITIRIPECPYSPYLPDRVLVYPSKNVRVRTPG